MNACIKTTQFEGFLQELNDVQINNEFWRCQPACEPKTAVFSLVTRPTQKTGIVNQSVYARLFIVYR